MSDVTPNYELEREGIDLEISQLELNIKSQKYRILQMDDEKARIEANMAATRDKIAELKDQLKGIKIA